MIRHLVAWNYRDGFSEAENLVNAARVKAELEALKQCVGGIVRLEVHTSLLPTGNRDILLDSLFESEEALAAYQVHPEHQRVSEFVGTVMQNRVCVDFPENCR